jgi:hypothetical protein
MTLCAALAAAACGASDAGRGIAVERTDSAGVEIVLSPGTDHPLDWRVEEVGMIDSESTKPVCSSRPAQWARGTLPPVI